jgi:hypothetical protein
LSAASKTQAYVNAGIAAPSSRCRFEPGTTWIRTTTPRRPVHQNLPGDIDGTNIEVHTA